MRLHHPLLPLDEPLAEPLTVLPEVVLQRLGRPKTLVANHAYVRQLAGVLGGHVTSELLPGFKLGLAERTLDPLVVGLPRVEDQLLVALELLAALLALVDLFGLGSGEGGVCAGLAVVGSGFHGIVPLVLFVELERF